MKRLLSLLFFLAGALTAYAYNPEIRDIDIRVSLTEDGTARITERWDVVVASGTEWYLVRSNLGDIDIENLCVTDETGRPFQDTGAWNVDLSLQQKAGKCGLHRISGGYEICWGVGSYGPHVFTVSYDMTNAVKSLNDFDMLHMQFVSSDLSANPGHVRLVLDAPVALDKENSNIWGFGYDGTVAWYGDGSVVAESDVAFDSGSSLILLLRFDKGIFNSRSVRDEDFETVLDRAREGAHFEEEDEEVDSFAEAIATLLTGLFAWFAFVRPFFRIFSNNSSRSDKRKCRKNLFGVKRLPSDPGWTRDLPFDGNILETFYVASHITGEDDRKFSVVSAFILRMMQHGVLGLREDAAGKKEFTFAPDPDLSYMYNCERKLYELIKEASGADEVLQEKEFSQWASSHRGKVRAFVDEMRDGVLEQFRGSGFLDGYAVYNSLRLNARGQASAMNALRFRQFLKDFTVINERYPGEVALWGEYLIMASIFGMAEQVAGEMKKIAPQITLGQINVSSGSFGDLVIFSNTFSNNVRRFYSTPVASSGGGYSGSYGRGSYGGFGGHSSRSGGGGFSGGGRGGGSR